MADLTHWLDPRSTSGPVVTLQAAMSDDGGIVALCVLVHDATRRQILRAPLPADHLGATVAELESAASLWLAILDGNCSDVRMLPDSH